jgi:hypothetical protein
MNIKFLSLFFLIIAAVQVQAQKGSANFFIKPRTYDQIFTMEMDYGLAGTAATNAMFYSYGFGGFIDEEMKEKAAKRLSHLNLLGQNTQALFRYQQQGRTILGMENAGWQMELAWKNYMEFEFTEDVFNLVFYGNKDYAGKTADLSNSELRTLNYYQIKGGMNFFSRLEKHYFAFNLALNLGNKFQEGRMNNSHFFTSLTGDSLSLDGNTNYRFIQSQADNPFDIFGFGAGLDLYYKYSRENKYNIEASIEGLGFIRWNKQQAHLDYSNPIIWEGVEVENILNLPNPLVNTSAGDSISNFIDANASSGNYLSYTPADLKLSAAYQLIKDAVELGLDLRYRFFSVFKPEYTLKVKLDYLENLSFIPNMSYGGYTRFNMGLGMVYRPTTSSTLEFHTRYLSGIFNQQSSSGIGGFISFTHQI